MTEEFKLEQGQKKATRKAPQIQSSYYKEIVAYLPFTMKPERRYDYHLDVFREKIPGKRKGLLK